MSSAAAREEEERKYLVHLAARVQHFQTGFEVKDRRWRLRTYEKCFVGEEAVNWMTINLHVSREEAVRLGRELQQMGVFQHVTGDHDFKDEQLFYRFSNPKTVVIVGGGFAGSMLAQKLEDEYRVVLVDEKPFFLCVPSLPTLLVDPTHYDKIAAEHSQYLKRARLVVARAEEIRPDAVRLSTGEVVRFDFLVLAMGSRYRVPDNSFIVNCVDYRQVAARYADLLAARRVCVLGGGPVGVEVAGEIASRFPEKQVVLVSRYALLERCCPAAHEHCRRTLEEFKNVELVLGESLASYGDGAVLTDKGTRIECDLVYPCLGFVPNTEPLHAHMAACLDERGLVRVDAGTFQVTAYPHVFAIGDVCNVPEEKLAQTAESHAAALATILPQLERHEPPTLYQVPRKRLLIVSVGPKRAVVVRGKKVLTEGMLASKLKSIVEWKIMRRVV